MIYLVYLSRVPKTPQKFSAHEMHALTHLNESKINRLRFTQGEQNTFILLSLFWKPSVKKKEDNFGGTFSQEQLLEIKCFELFGLAACDSTGYISHQAFTVT